MRSKLRGERKQDAMLEDAKFCGVAAAVVGSVVGAAAGVYSSNKASNAQVQSAKDANALAKETSDQQIALQREQFNKNIELQQPMIDAGNTSRNRLMQLLALAPGGEGNGSANKDFGMTDFQSDPGYQFRMSEGQKGLERSAASRGGLMSGAAGKEMERFSQGLASQDYQAAFDRFQVNRANKLNPLQSMTNTGQTAATTLGVAGQSYANGAGNALSNFASAAGQNITGAGNARASGYIGTGNAINNGIGQAFNGFQQNRLMDLYGQNQNPVGGYNDEMARINAQLKSGG
jgi:hypothetical protein